MKKINISINIDGNELERVYSYEDDISEIDWDVVINSMADTIEKSYDTSTAIK